METPKYLISLFLPLLKRQGLLYGEQLRRHMVKGQKPSCCDVIKVLLVPAPPFL